MPMFKIIIFCWIYWIKLCIYIFSTEVAKSYLNLLFNIGYAITSHVSQTFLPLNKAYALAYSYNLNANCHSDFLIYTCTISLMHYYFILSLICKFWNVYSILIGKTSKIQLTTGISGSLKLSSRKLLYNLLDIKSAFY